MPQVQLDRVDELEAIDAADLDLTPAVGDGDPGAIAGHGELARAAPIELAQLFAGGGIPNADAVIVGYRNEATTGDECERLDLLGVSAQRVRGRAGGGVPDRDLLVGGVRAAARVSCEPFAVERQRQRLRS